MLRYAHRFLYNTSKLFTVASFFRLKSPDLTYFQYIYPTILTVLSFLVFAFFPSKYIVVDLKLLLTSATTLMGVLVGFYIAALAAVTSFPNASLDNIMAGNAPTITEIIDSSPTKVTRRRFLSILLGYCAFTSIIVFSLGSVFAAVKFTLVANSIAVLIIKMFCWLLYSWLLSSLFIVTALCLHYLIERMHRE